MISEKELYVLEFEAKYDIENNANANAFKIIKLVEEIERLRKNQKTIHDLCPRCSGYDNHADCLCGYELANLKERADNAEKRVSVLEEQQRGSAEQIKYEKSAVVGLERALKHTREELEMFQKDHVGRDAFEIMKKVAKCRQEKIVRQEKMLKEAEQIMIGMWEVDYPKELDDDQDAWLKEYQDGV